MGRKGQGNIEVRETTIRIRYTLERQRRYKTLFLNGQPLAPTKSNIAYARRIAAEIQDKIRLGVFIESDYFPYEGCDTGKAGEGVMLYGQLDHWLASQRLAESTIKSYGSAIKFWKANLTDRPLKVLKHSDVLKVLAERPDLTGKTVNNYVSIMRESCELAVMDNILTVNPVRGVKRAKHQSDPPDPFEPDEVEAILAHMRAKYPEQVALYTEFKFFTGLRSSETFGLRWPKVDLRSKYLMVTEAKVRGKALKRTKTNVARKVLLNSRAMACLKAQALHTRMKGDEVFYDPRYDLPWADERAFRRSYWIPTLKTLGIRYRPPYNTRHTYATMMLHAGMKPGFCAKQLGHSTEMFFRTYSTWLDGKRDDLEMDLLETSLQQRRPGPNSGPNVGNVGAA